MEPLFKGFLVADWGFLHFRERLKKMAKKFTFFVHFQQVTTRTRIEPWWNLNLKRRRLRYAQQGTRIEPWWNLNHEYSGLPVARV